MMRKKKPSLILLLLVCGLLATCVEADTWYKGCYFLPESSTSQYQPWFDRTKKLTPASCSKKCREAKVYSFAFLHNGFKCLCRKSLTRRASETNCNMRCRGDEDAYMKCGGSKWASVYTINGPFITSLEVIGPSNVFKNEEISIRIKVELGADPTSRFGVRRFDEMSFHQVKATIRLYGSKTTIINIKGKKGVLDVKYRMRKEGTKTIDVSVVNDISREDRRIRISVLLRIPKIISIRDNQEYGYLSCTPVSNRQQSTFVGEEITFTATLMHGSNLTFVWNFCGLETRKVTPHLRNSACRDSVAHSGQNCRRNQQNYTFNTPGPCVIKLRVHNDFGFESSNRSINVIFPEFRNLSLHLVQDDSESDYLDSYDSPRFDPSPPWLSPPFNEWGGLEEGGTEDSRDLGRGVSYSEESPLPDYSTPNLFPFMITTPPSVIEEDSGDDNRIELDEGQYLRNSKVSFQARVYMIKISEDTKVEINFGDGHNITQNLETSRRFGYGSRRKRSFIQSMQKNDLTKNRVKRLIDLDLHFLNGYGPGSDRSGSFLTDDFLDSADEIDVQYDNDCLMRISFSHKYTSPGEFNASITVFNGSRNLFAELESPVHVLDGTSDLIIQCPEATEIGKSIILSAKTMKTLPKFLKWKMFRLFESDQSWMLVTERQGSSFKKSFLRRGTYKIKVESEANHSSTCLVQVEKPLTNLKVTIPQKYVKTGDEVEIGISLGDGSAAVVGVYSENEIVSSLIRNVHKNSWTARFRITAPICYNVYVTAKNPITNLTSEMHQICGEDQISGYTMDLPEYLEIRSRGKISLMFEKGTNISLHVDVLTVSGRLLVSLDQHVPSIAETIEIMTPVLEEPGIYRVEARAHNHVAARSDTCEDLSEVSVRGLFVVSRKINPSTKLILARKEISREKNNEEPGRILVYKARVNDKLLHGIDILYRWTVQNTSSTSLLTWNRKLIHYTVSPIFSISLPRCDAFSPVEEGVVIDNDVADVRDYVPLKCKISVDVISRTGNVSRFQILSTSWNSETEQNLILPRASVFESSKSCEFDLKCPEQTEMCEVSFGDDSQSARIPSNANGNSLSHAFTKPGLYQVTLKSTNTGVLSIIHVMVQESIQGIRLQGKEILSYEVDARGSWRVTSATGSHKVYQWKIHFANGTLHHSEITRESEWEFSFPDYGVFTISVLVFNDISSQQKEMTVDVQSTPWHFTVQTNNSVLGEDSIFIIETNANRSTVAIKFSESNEAKILDLSCMKPNFTNVDGEKRLISTYIIYHKYNQTGSYKPSFTLLSHEVGRNERSYTLQTEVLHKPAPKSLTIDIISSKKAYENGIHYIPTRTAVVIRASINFNARMISWNVYGKQGQNREIIHHALTSVENSTYSEFTYIIERHGMFEISATSLQLTSTILVEGEEMIQNIYIDSPYKDPKFVDSCRVKRIESKWRCENITLGATSDGTNVAFTFYIYFREEVLDDYSAPTEIIDTVKVRAKQTQTSSDNEVSVDYIFRKQGVYYITVEASNHFSNRSAARDTIYNGNKRPYLFYAQRHVSKIELPKSIYYVALNNQTRFEVRLPNNQDQVWRITWKMGDGTTHIGRVVHHTYTSKGIKRLEVTVKNFVSHKVKTAKVQVEIPIQHVKLERLTRAYTTDEDVNLHSIVTPSKSASHFTWILTNDNKTKGVPNNPDLRHNFHESGLYLVKVIAANHITAFESEPIEVEIVDPIHRMLIGDDVVRVNELIELEIHLTMGKDVSITWTIDDGPVISRSLTLEHVFEKIGIYMIKVEMSKNFIKFGPKKLDAIRKKIFVVKKFCTMPEIEIAGQTWKGNLRRSKPLRLEAQVTLNCSYVAKVNYQWTTIKEWNYNETEIVHLTNADTSSRILELPPRTLEYGSYTITVNVSLEDSILFKSAEIHLRVHPSDLVPFIDGGTVRAISRNSNVVLDASKSYDPDYPDQPNELSFEWQCIVLNSPSKPCFLEELPNTAITEGATGASSSSMRAASGYQSSYDGTEEVDVYKKFPQTISRNSSILTFPASFFVTNAETFIFKVSVSKYNRAKDADVVITVRTNETEWVKLTCAQCQETKAIRHLPLRFDATCITCETNDTNQVKTSYKWSLIEIVDENIQSFYENETSNCAPPDGSGWMRLIGILGNYSEPANGTSPEIYPDETDEWSEAFVVRGSVNHSNMRDGYRGHNALGASPSPQEDPEEGDTASRFHSSNFEQRSGSVPNTGESPYETSNHLTGDPFRNQEFSHDFPASKHYQDSKEKKLALDKFALTDTNRNILILRPNSLHEGKTYAVVVDVETRTSQNDAVIKSGTTSFYFTILRGPTYGDCSVVYRKTSDTHQVHCAQWKNRQNDNENDRISKNEVLSYDISYSLTRDGPTRHIYSGVSFERHIELPPSTKEEYIHISLKNSDGATTNVCSFPVKVRKMENILTSEEWLNNAYDRSVPENSELNQLIAKDDREEIIALVNVVLDTIPASKELDEIPGSQNEESGREKSKKIIQALIRALRTIEPRKTSEVLPIMATLNSALQRYQLLSIGAAFEAAELLIETLRSLEKILGNQEKRCKIQTGESFINAWVSMRYRLSIAFKECISQAFAERHSTGLSFRTFESDPSNSSIILTHRLPLHERLIRIEKSIVQYMNKFLSRLAEERPRILGPLRSNVNGFGLVVQKFDEIVTVFSDEKTNEKKRTGHWKVGAIFPKNFRKRFQKLNLEYQIATTLPDNGLKEKFQKYSIEERPLSLGVFNTSGGKRPVRNLSPPIIIALPPRNTDDNLFNGFVLRDRVAMNSFSILRRLNQTLHLEIVFSPRQRSFPVTVSISDKNLKSVVGVLQAGTIIANRTVTRGEFQNSFNENTSVVVKFTLRHQDFTREYATYYLSMWNEQSMTSRSRHYDVDKIPYSLKVWWSDCYYWDEFSNEWRHDGVEVLEQSTASQTLCSTTHLSTFSASYLALMTDSRADDIGIPLYYTAFRGSVVITSLIFLMTAVFLYIHHSILRPHSVETPKSVFRLDYYWNKSKFSEIGRRLRWYFGPDHNANAVPVTLYDNRQNHKQVYEVTIQTSCWPGSGTTSNVKLILFGEKGKYDARELVTPKTHSARESRYENGYSENDDYTGVDDELFITGSTQSFTITFPKYLGPIWKLILWHDQSGECPSWRVDYITVRDATNNKKWHFPLFDWLALDKGSKTISTELRPLQNLPKLLVQISLKMNAYLFDFSSLCSCIASPGYGHLPRSQRIVHIVSLILSICGLTTVRYMLEWDIYSHDTDLPYLHCVSITWGLLIGCLAIIIVLPPQLLFRFSKRDERVSVTIEDATGSMLGTEFAGDGTTINYSSTFDIPKQIDNYKSNPDLSRKSALKPEDTNEIADYISGLPSVEETVCDWLELKEWAERKNATTPARPYAEKEHNLPEPRVLSSTNWHHSMGSLDDEIARCMMTSSPGRRNHIRRELISPSCATDFDDKEGKFGLFKTHYMSEQSIDALDSVASASFLHRSSADFAYTYPILLEKNEEFEKISPLAMDGPELVPCAKLEPISTDFNALLPRSCKNVAWLYYLLLWISAASVSIYGSVAVLRYYDIGSWFECILCSSIGAMVFIEGTFILCASILSSVYLSVKSLLRKDELSNLLDRVFSIDKFNEPCEKSLDLFIDSTSYYPNRENDPISAHDEYLLEDARMAREIADRERSRYLRHIKPTAPPPGLQEKLTKTQKMKESSIAWISILFLLILGITLSVVVTSDFKESFNQSRNVEIWFKSAISRPILDAPSNAASGGGKFKAKLEFESIQSRDEWFVWFKKLLVHCPKSERNLYKVEDIFSPSDKLLHRDKIKRKTKGQLKDSRFLLVGKPVLTIRRLQEGNEVTVPSKMTNILNFTNVVQPTHYSLNTIPEVNSMLTGTKSSKEDAVVTHTPTTTYVFDSWQISGNEEMEKLLEIKEIIRNDATVHSVLVDIVLYNPFTNLYSQISATSQFQHLHGVNSLSQALPSSTVIVSSIPISQEGLNGTQPHNRQNAFYMCQLLLVIWASLRVLSALLCSINNLLGLLSGSPSDRCCKSPKFPRVFEIFHDIALWTLVVICIFLSAIKRNIIESMIPNVYGYETSNSDDIFFIIEIANYTTKYATALGLLNFTIIIKILWIARKYHNVPRMSNCAKTRVSSIVELVLILLLFWTVTILLAFVAHIAFSDNIAFSTFLHSLMNIVLASITLGIFPANTPINLAMIRAKYGVIVVTWFFLTVFVTLRIIFRGLLIAALRKNIAESRRTQRKDGLHDYITLRELLNYNWVRLKTAAIYIVCILLRKDPGMLGVEGDIEFSSLSFSKSKRLTERERKKLGSSPAVGCSSSSMRNKVSEEKNDSAIISSLPATNGKYELPKEVWLYEVESQLDELYLRASALADIACSEISPEPQSECENSEDSGRDCAKSLSSSTIKSPSRHSVAASTVTSKSSKDSQLPQARALIFSKSSARINKNQSLKSHPQSYSTNNILEKKNGTKANKIQAVKELEKQTRNRDPPEKTAAESSHIGRQSGPSKKFPAKRNSPQKLATNENNPAISHRKLVWNSEEYVGDSTDISKAPSSSSEEHTLPPLTAHNLARHNYNIISRQSSAASRGRHQSGNETAEKSQDVPSTSTSSYEDSPDTARNLQDRLLKTLRSFKNLVAQGDVPQEINNRPRTLRRSRTTAINVKDIPSLESLQDGGAESENTGKNSSASTSKLHNLFKSTTAKRRLRHDGCKVEIVDVTSQISSSPSHSPQSEMTSLPSRSTFPSRASYFSGSEEFDTFSIPGTVSEKSFKCSPPRKMGQNVVCRDGVSPSHKHSPQVEKDHDNKRQRRRTYSRSTANSEYSRRSVPPRINEEETREEDLEIVIPKRNRSGNDNIRGKKNRS